MAELRTEQFEAASARGEARMRGPRAATARFDAGRNRIIVRLTTGIEIGFAPADAEGCSTLLPTISKLSNSMRSARVSTFPQSTPIFTCRPCWKE